MREIVTFLILAMSFSGASYLTWAATSGSTAGAAGAVGTAGNGYSTTGNLPNEGSGNLSTRPNGEEVGSSSANGSMNQDTNLNTGISTNSESVQ